jgi:hypothetical protein
MRSGLERERKIAPEGYSLHLLSLRTERRALDNFGLGLKKKKKLWVTLSFKTERRFLSSYIKQVLTPS